MKRILLTFMAIIGVSALADAQIKITPKTTTTTTVKTEPKTTVDFNKKKIISTQDQTVTTQTRTTAPVTTTRKKTVDFENKRVITRTSGPVVIKDDGSVRKYKTYKKKNKKYKSKFANGHDNRTKSKHHNSKGHDNRKKSKHHD